jgi:DNA-binding GntR family transcriptional regulator
MSGAIATFIKGDLKARLRAGDGVPEKLTLAALSDHYQVSFTPVRQALQELIDEQVLCKGANGRLSVNPAVRSGQREESPLPEPPPPAAEIESALAGEIIQMSLRGETDYLREEVTAERFGIGRTVLRQMLNRLAGKGLVEHLPRRGWQVHRFNEAEMIAYLQVRESLELKALELAQPHVFLADLKRMLRSNRPEHGHDADRLDNYLHRYLIEKSGNRFIKEFFDRHGVYFAMLFDYAAPEANVVRAMARQHRVILRAMLRGEWPAARKALAHHIRSQRPIVQRLLQQVSRPKAVS